MSYDAECWHRVTITAIVKFEFCDRLRLVEDSRREYLHWRCPDKVIVRGSSAPETAVDNDRAFFFEKFYISFYYIRSLCL